MGIAESPLSVVLVAEQLRRRVPGGIGTCIRSLLRGWSELGQESPRVTLWASRSPGGPDPLAELGTVVTSRLPAPVLVRAWDRGLVPAPRGADVVLAPSLATPPSATPLVTSVWDLTWKQMPEAFPPRGRRWHEAALGRAVDRSRILVAPSVATADQLMAHGVDADQIEVIEPGCDHLPEPDDSAAAALLAGLGVEGDYLLTVSTQEPRKNLDRLVAAYARARHRIGDAPLLVVGPPGWGPAPVGVPGVLFTGWIDDPVLAGLYQRARMVASVPLAEGFGLGVVEAMRAGVPVVASPIPSVQGAAREADPTDVDAIAAALVEVFSDGSLRRDLIDAGTARTQELTWRRCAAHHRDVLRAAVVPGARRLLSSTRVRP